jgi:hypothetical protein
VTRPTHKGVAISAAIEVNTPNIFKFKFLLHSQCIAMLCWDLVIY